MKFVEVIPCEVDKKSNDMCVTEGLGENRRISILGRKRCFGVTGKERQYSNEIDIGMGTHIKDFVCDDPSEDRSGTGILDVDIQEYLEIDPIDITGSTVAAEVAKSVAESDYAKRKNIRFSAAQSQVWKFAFPGSREVFFVNDGDLGESPQMMIERGEVRPINEQLGYCGIPMSSFRFNGMDVLRYHLCTCQTDGCVTDYFKI